MQWSEREDGGEECEEEDITGNKNVLA